MKPERIKDLLAGTPYECANGKGKFYETERPGVIPKTALEPVYGNAAFVACLTDAPKNAARVQLLAKALRRLRDCDWVISLPDRMDAVRDIAAHALAEAGLDNET